MKFLPLLVLLISLDTFCFAQDSSIFIIDSLPPDGVLLDKNWKWHAGDNPEFAKADFDDSAWQNIDPLKTIHYLPQIRKKPVGWLRVKLKIDSSLLYKPLSFAIYQTLASEIFLNGKLIKQFGVVSLDKNKIKAIQPLYAPVGIQFDNSEMVLAVRFSVQPGLYYANFHMPFRTFLMRINDVWGAGQFNRIGHKFPVLNGLHVGVYMILSIIHFFFFFLSKKQKANLFFALATLSGVIANLLELSFLFTNDVSYRATISNIEYIFLLTLYNLFLYVAIYCLFSQKKGIIYILSLSYLIAGIGLWFIFYERSVSYAFIFPCLFCMSDAIRIAFIAFKKGVQDAKILLFGLVTYIVFLVLFILILEGYLADSAIGFGNKFTLMDLSYNIYTNSVILALAIYLSRDFAFTSRDLDRQLAEVQRLSEEKQHILAIQNKTLELQVAERTNQLSQSLADLRATQAQLIQSEKLASLGELTAGIAHEIQNPLNFVNNFAEVSAEMLDEMHEELEKGDTTEAIAIATDLKTNLEKINHHGQRASSIVKGMLEHSRASTGVKEPTDLNALADEYLRLAYHGLRAKDNTFNATIETHFDPDLPKVSVIHQDIGRVLLNLINNAFYAVAERSRSTVDQRATTVGAPLVGAQPYEPTVTVSTKKLENTVEIRVKDNGPGIPEAIRDKIFQPFFTTKPTGQGTGLGLSLAYDIVTKGHGGTLEVNSVVNEETEFVIRLINH